MDPPASAVCFSRSDLSLLSEEPLHLDWLAPWWDSPTPSPEPGPMNHEERGVARVIDLNVMAGDGETEPVPQHWSTLSAAGMEHIYEEANRLARQLHRLALKEGVEEAPLVGPLRKAKAVVRSPRRETYMVKDSPSRLLLPNISREGDSLLSDAEEALPCPVSDGAEGTSIRCKATPSHKGTLAGGKALPGRDKCTANRSKATSGGAAHRVLVPRQGFQPKTCSVGTKQQDLKSSPSAGSAVQCPPRGAGSRKAEHRDSRLVAPTSQLSRMSSARQQARSRLQASKSGAPPLSDTGGGLSGSSVLWTARREGPGKPASIRVARPAMGRSAPQPQGQASDPGFQKGLSRIPLTRQGSTNVGTRAALSSGTGRPKLTQTGSQRAG